ncbi:uncharacterized protein LOC105191466 [Harpegnathos saltator]|uniref:uncharacterized protein LOC105191466 n=1 Tax=Harpegnathos saltator TaxID=610380 RepID=UPI000DBEED1D|nr:uncharacterized protein LOC105191466 [Harpegnathos saltator]
MRGNCNCRCSGMNCAVNVKRLNSLPGPKKSVKLWHTVWRDLKSVSSRKASKLRAEHLRTGNFPAEEAPLQNIEQRVVSAIGLDYVEGNVHCPNSCVEEDENIERLEMDDEDPLYQIPQTLTLRDTIFANEERLKEKFPSIVDEEHLTLQDVEEAVLDYPDAVITVAAAVAVEADSETRSLPVSTKRKPNPKKRTAELGVRKSTITCPTTDAASSNRKNRQCISVQLENAREQFTNIAQSNASALKIIAESIERLATVEERRAAIEERRARSEEMSLQLLKNISEYIKYFCEK